MVNVYSLGIVSAERNKVMWSMRSHAAQNQGGKDSHPDKNLKVYP